MPHLHQGFYGCSDGRLQPGSPTETLAQYEEYKNLEITGEYSDAEKSGKSIAGRSAFMEMMEDIASEKDQISYVLVFKLSRFRRNAADVLKSIQTLLYYGVNLVRVEDSIDSSTHAICSINWKLFISSL